MPSQTDSKSTEARERLRDRLLLSMGGLMSVGAASWSALSYAYGFHLAALIPVSYLVLTAANFGIFLRTRHFPRAAFVQVLASVSLPFLFQLALGGIAASGASMSWALVAVVGALTFSEARRTLHWVALFVALSIACAVLDGAARANAVREVPTAIARIFLFGNLILISCVILALVFYFIDQRERAVDALARARVKIADLRKEVDEARQLGQYTLVEKIGAGGMGAVYRARHAMLRRPTALKLVRPEKASEATLARFEREVQLTATLSHPNVVTVYDYGRTEDGTFYYTMELLEGADLGMIVRRTGPMPPGRAVYVLTQIASALAAAHRAGLIHRDVKPANVLLTNSWAPDVVKVVDFGLVKEIATPGADESLSEQGTVSGTPAYMSPEAIMKPASVDGRSDVYSLGCLAYFLVTGAEPFRGENAFDLWRSQIESPAIPPSLRSSIEVPAALDALIMQCLEKSAAARPTMADVHAALLRLANEPWAEWSLARSAEWWEQHRTSLAGELDQQKSIEDTVIARAQGKTAEVDAA
jgi:serine/threonine protein kinase